jgi:hypothetical protein
MNDFFKSFQKRDKSIISNNNLSFLNDTKTVCVKMMDGTIIEYDNVKNPWAYINKIKKNLNVQNAWIKNE